MKAEGNEEARARLEQLAERWRRPTKSPPRLHHYVPKFYLRDFADGKGRVARVSRSTGEVDIVPAKRAAAEIDFNRIELPTGEVLYEVENMLAWVENGAAPALRRIGRGTFPPSEKDRDALAGFLGLQYARGRDKRDKHQLIEEWMLRFMAKENFSDPERVRSALRETTGVEPTDEEVADMVRFATDPDAYEIEIPDTNSIKIMLEVARETMLYFFNISWSCLRFDRRLLITSDTPVNLWSKPQEMPSFMGRGLVTSDEVRFAVDPKAILVLMPEGPSHHATLSDEWAWEVNKNTIVSAYRWVFAPPGHPDLERISEHARATPESGIEIHAFGEKVLLRRDPPEDITPPTRPM